MVQLVQEKNAIPHTAFHRSHYRNTKKGKIMPATNVLYILDCLHVMPGTRASLDKLFCYNCTEQRQIIGAHPYEWHAVCVSVNCRWGKWTALSKETANYFARIHAQKNGHECKVRYEPSPEGTDAEKRLRKAGIVK